MQKHYERHILTSARSGAKQRGLEFSIDLADIHIPDKCPYLGTPLTRIFGEGKVKTNASIDRVDPTKGYVKGNIEIISLKANMMKQDATVEELTRFAKSVLKRTR